MAYSPDGAPSPRTSPAEPLCESPEQDSVNLSMHTDDSMTRSLDSLSEYDHLSRSPLCEERGLGPSGLDRIRQQQPRVLTLPNMSTPSLGPPTPRRRSPSPRSHPPSSARSTRAPSNSSLPALADLHRFPSESLHSFSFAQQSEELFHNRQNILKRSIDFMRGRFGRASDYPAIASARARAGGGDVGTKSTEDLLSRASISGKEDRSNHPDLVRGPMTGPAYTDCGNVFEQSFSEHRQPVSESERRESARENGLGQDSTSEYAHLFSPLPNDHIIRPKREMKSSPSSRRVSLKRTFSDVSSVTLQSKLMQTLAHPYSTADPLSSLSSSTWGLGFPVPALHTHSSKWNPVSQAVFRTEARAPWTILAANDLSCLVFGVAQSEVRKLSILEVVHEDHRQWLESKLRDPATDAATKRQSSPDRKRAAPVNARSMGLGNGVTAQLLSKPPSRASAPKRSQTDDTYSAKRNTAPTNHAAHKSRGVLLCGDVVPIQKRNGTQGSASVWVIEKRGGLIWVFEEITEDVAYMRCDDAWNVVEAHGDIDKIWGQEMVKSGRRLTELLPRLPKESLKGSLGAGLAQIAERKHFAALTSAGISIPVAITKAEDERSLRISSFPHVAGIMVLSSSTLKVVSSNSVFSSALFGQERPEGMLITELVPGFSDLLYVLSEEDKVPFVDGMLIPQHSFRRARTLSILREGKSSVASVFAEPTGLAANHRDGSSIAVDIQMRVMKSGTIFPNAREKTIVDDGYEDETVELVYALWITYSRQIHSTGPATNWATHSSEAATSPAQPAASPTPTPNTTETAQSPVPTQTPSSSLSQQLSEAASEPLTDKPIQPVPQAKVATSKNETPAKRTISDYVILEEMGQGAYGEVKLARQKKNAAKKVVLKYVTKKKILMDTWTRDRRLGTVPLEIHVLDYLRRDGLKHPNIVEMEGFFEDDVNYYIEMMPHGLPGMDLFDYIELKANMDESECKNIFGQVVDAIHHLHTKALVVHRDIKDENVILDGEGKIKLIDFGSAAYIKNGPFDVFVGTIDYAAPEVLQGKSYRGKEQDIWALGILLYTIVYKENPFYNVDEILDHPLRVPFLPFSEDCIDLIRRMLDRDVDNRLTITEVMEHPWMTDS